MLTKIFCFAIQFCEEQARDHAELAAQRKQRGEDAAAFANLESSYAWSREVETIKAMMKQETGTTYEQAMNE